MLIKGSVLATAVLAALLGCDVEDRACSPGERWHHCHVLVKPPQICGCESYWNVVRACGLTPGDAVARTRADFPLLPGQQIGAITCVALPSGTPMDSPVGIELAPMTYGDGVGAVAGAGVGAGGLDECSMVCGP